MDVPSWALVAMWGATMTGAYFLTKEMMRRFA